MDERKCLQCSEQLRGRLDQKFCNDQCRSAYNNSLNTEANIVVKKINRILKKNYAILATLSEKGKTIVTKNDLQKNGYCFDYFTCICLTRKNQFSYYCYDHGYRENENNKLVLVHRELVV